MVNVKTVSTITIGENNFYEGDLVTVMYTKDDKVTTVSGRIDKIRRSTIIIDSSTAFNSNTVELLHENLDDIAKLDMKEVTNNGAITTA